MRRAALALALSLAAGSVAAQSLKLGTLAPVGSPWEQALRKVGAEWSRISGGRVTLRVYPGGVAGDEDDMLRKIRIGQLHAAALSGPALATIVPGVLALQVPLLVSGDDELEYLMEKMTPDFARQFEEKGFKLLAWTRAGWAYIFARDPVLLPEDLKRQKLMIWQGSTEEARAWRDMGFQPVTLGSADIMVQLQSGGIDAFVTSPLVAGANQYFAVANDMTDMKWAPFVGGLLVSRRVWETIPADLRPRLERVTMEITESYREEFLGADAEAIGVMRRHGLTLHQVSPAAREAWRQFVARGVNALFGGRLDMKTYETASRHLEDLRGSGPRR